MDWSPIEKLANENIGKALLKQTVPSIIMVLINALYNIADAFFVGILGDTFAIAAISVVFPVFVLIGAAGSVFGIGGGTCVSRFLGEKKKNEADAVSSVSVMSLLVLSFVIAYVLLVFLSPLLDLLGASESVLPYAVSYCRILVYGIPVNLALIGLGSMIRSEGNVVYSMKVTLAGVMFNIVLDPVFIFVFGLGLDGSAYATVVSQTLSLLCFLVYYGTGKNHVNISLRLAKPQKAVYSGILNIGIPVFIKQFLLGISVIMVNYFIAPYGETAVAAMGITLRVTSMGLLVLYGFSAGVQPLAAYTYGAVLIGKLNELKRISFRWVAVFSLIFSAVLYVLAPEILSGFSRDITVIERGTILFRAYLITFPVLGGITFYGSLLEAMGAGKDAFILAVLNQGVFFILSLYAGDKFFGFTGIAFAQSASNILAFILTVFTAAGVNRRILRPFQSAAGNNHSA